MRKPPRNKTFGVNEVPVTSGRQKKERTPSQRSPSTSGGNASSPDRLKCILILVVLLVSFGVYFNALSGDFVFDDRLQIVENPWIRDIRYVPTIFSKSVSNFQPGLSPSNYYRPLMHILYMFVYHIFGLNPLGFHLVNILLHCGASLLVFLVVEEILREQRNPAPSGNLLPPFIAALLFASHPIHTEAVTWIAGLPDVSFAFFTLLSFYLYISRDRIKGAYTMSILSFLVAALFKEPALTLPLILVVYDCIVKRSDGAFRAAVKRYIPYVAVSCVYLLLRYHALGGFAPVPSDVRVSAHQLIVNVFPLLREYLGGLLWPFNLNLWHAFSPLRSLFELKGMISLAVVVLFLLGGAAAYKKNRLLFLALLFVVVPLLPAFYIKAISGTPFAERYLYLPTFGFALLPAIFLAWAERKMPRVVRSITLVAFTVAGLYSVLTIERNGIWKDNFTLWSDTVRKSPASAEPHYNLGIAYKSRGQLDRAIAEYRTALRLKPDYAEVHNNLGIAYASMGRADMAIAEFRTVLRQHPGYAKAHYNLGVAYASTGRVDDAVAEFRTVLWLKPDYYDARRRLADIDALRR